MGKIIIIGGQTPKAQAAAEKLAEAIQERFGEARAPEQTFRFQIGDYVMAPVQTGKDQTIAYHAGIIVGSHHTSAEPLYDVHIPDLYPKGSMGYGNPLASVPMNESDLIPLPAQQRFTVDAQTMDEAKCAQIQAAWQQALDQADTAWATLDQTEPNPVDDPRYHIRITLAVRHEAEPAHQYTVSLDPRNSRTPETGTRFAKLQVDQGTGTVDTWGVLLPSSKNVPVVVDLIETEQPRSQAFADRLVKTIQEQFGSPADKTASQPSPSKHKQPEYEPGD